MELMHNFDDLMKIHGMHGEVLWIYIKLAVII